MNITRALQCAAISAAAIGVSIVAGCSSNPTSTNTSGDAIVAPKTGSTYTVASYDTDSTGTKVPGSDSTLIYTVVATGVTIGGKSDVIEFIGTNGGSPRDTAFIHYESNGDVSEYFESSSAVATPQAWITTPYASKSSKTTTLLDSSFTDSTFGASHISAVATTSGSGSESITVSAGAFTANKGLLKLAASFSVSGIPLVSVNITYNRWFVPKIGFYVKSVTSGGAAFIGSGSSGNVQTLTSYTLK